MIGLLLSGRQIDSMTPSTIRLTIHSQEPAGLNRSRCCLPRRTLYGADVNYGGQGTWGFLLEMLSGLSEGIV